VRARRRSSLHPSMGTVRKCELALRPALAPHLGPPTRVFACARLLVVKNLATFVCCPVQLCSTFPAGFPAGFPTSLLRVQNSRYGVSRLLFRHVVISSHRPHGGVGIPYEQHRCNCQRHSTTQKHFRRSSIEQISFTYRLKCMVQHVGRTTINRSFHTFRSNVGAGTATNLLAGLSHASLQRDPEDLPEFSVGGASRVVAPVDTDERL
jgi:hypothetical protein